MMERMIAPGRSILRDLLQYLVPACFTTVIILYLYGEKIYTLSEHFINEYAIMFGILLVILTYLTGQIIYIMSKVFVAVMKKRLRFLFKGRWNDIRKITKLLSALNVEKQLQIHKDFLDGDQMHLYAEMAVFARLPELHASYIERQNNLMYFTQTLSMAALINAVFLVVHSYNNWLDIMLAAAFLGLSLLLFHEYLGRVKYFYERVYVAFVFSENEKSQAHGE